MEGRRYAVAPEARFAALRCAGLVMAGGIALSWSCGAGVSETEAPAAQPAEGQESAAQAAATEAGPSGPSAGLLQLAPDFTLPDVEGRSFRFADTAGQVRLVDFWATWCRPCIEEIPMFKQLHETYAPQGFTLIAIALEDGGAEVVRPFVARYGLPYVNLIGDERVAQQFGGIFGFPTAFLVDREGRVVERFIGPKPRSVLERKIRELLGLEAPEAGAEGR